MMVDDLQHPKGSIDDLAEKPGQGSDWLNLTPSEIRAAIEHRNPNLGTTIAGGRQESGWS